MKKLMKLVVCFLLIGSYTSVYSQFESIYMSNPDQAIDVVINEVDFWSQYQDNTYGGFINEVSNDGSYSPTSQKSFCSNSRLAYAFTRAFMLTGNFDYLEKARHALVFIYQYGWDKTYGGWYYASNYNGSNPQQNTYNSGKWSYTQHYCMLGNVAMNEATGGTVAWNDGNETDLAWMYRGLDVIYDNLWDNSAGISGFYETANDDWSNKHNKGFTPTADGLTTHATVMSLRNIDDFYVNSYFTLIDRIAYDIVPQTYSASSPLIYEYANTNWEPFGEELFNGHAVKCAWNLARAYLIDPTKSIYKEKAQQILDELLDRGYYDNMYGGIHYFQKGGQKSHWTQEQGILAGILVAQITDDPEKKQRYLNLADGCWKFMEDHMIDFESGGSYTDVQTSGAVSSQWGKGDYWEAGYHTTETAYYTYLYGNIYMKNKPVELYYYFAPQGVAQTHTLTPLSIETNSLIIEKIAFNGNDYLNFDSKKRELHIAANQGGTFKITFRHNPDVFICPTVALGADVSICELGSYSIDPQLYADGNIDFTWYKDGVVVAGPDITTNTFTADDAGTYVLEISGENCYSTDQIEINNSLPAFSLGNDFVYTKPIQVSTQLSTNFEHTWFFNGNEMVSEKSNVITISQAGIYGVEVSSALCGSSYNEIIVSNAPTLAYAPAAIVVDGAKDVAYNLSLSSDNYVLNAVTELDLSAQWSALWDNNNIYVHVSVTDDNLSSTSGSSWWDGDGIEIYIDGDNSKNTRYDIINDFQWGFNWNSTAVKTGANNPANSTVGIRFSIVETANGYNAEIAIPWSTIGVDPVNGNSIGIEIGINDNDDGGSRDSKLMWYATVDDSWQNPSLFAEFILSGSNADLIPFVDAGLDVILVKPVSSTSLNASVSGGDGIITYLWSSSSSAVISDVHSLAPTVSGLTLAGTYTFTLMATDQDGDTDSDSVTVSVVDGNIPVTAISIINNDIQMTVGEAHAFEYSISPFNATNQNVLWSCSNSNVSIDQNGIVTANRVGTSVVTVTSVDGNYSDNITVSVVSLQIPVNGVTINHSAITMNEGEMMMLDYSVLPSNASNTNVNWLSDNSSVLVGQDGKITAIRQGNATVTVTTVDGHHTDQILVGVVKNESECLEINIPQALHWDILNDWNDKYSGSSVVTENQALQFQHRAWGNNNVYLVQVGVPLSVQSGTAYTISFDINDVHTRMSQLKAGFCASVAWNAPSSVISTVETAFSPYGNGNFTRKSVTVTASESSDNAMLFFYLSVNTQISAQNYLLKNIEICSSNVKNKHIELPYSSRAADITAELYPNPAVNYITSCILQNKENECHNYSILSSSGQEIVSEKRAGALQTFNLERIPSGNYMLKISETYLNFSVIK
ncbi:MAG: AGE family epimerase/isomerase [Bacteroidales bacterium]|nr:AGE family epimerase/isomerase [Bacteroidales bacterium]